MTHRSNGPLSPLSQSTEGWAPLSIVGSSLLLPPCRAFVICDIDYSSKLESLPEELLQLIVSYLPTPAQRDVALVSSTLNRHATDFLWRSVVLVDQWTSYFDVDEVQTLHREVRGLPKTDEHDDTPILRKLFILAT